MPVTDVACHTEASVSRLAPARLFVLAAALAFTSSFVRAAELPNLDQFTGMHGEYGPDGDCTRQPRIVVDGDGMTVENGTGRYKFERFEHAVNFGGNGYSGISVWLMPLHGSERPMLMTFNSDEQAGLLAVEPYDRGWDGGPPLSARHQRLVDASPYRKCGDTQQEQAPETESE